MAVSFDRKILNGNNLYIDDPHDKDLATPAQVKKAAKRGKKTLKRFWSKEIDAQITEPPE
jgi:hypothetical protein